MTDYCIVLPLILINTTHLLPLVLREFHAVIVRVASENCSDQYNEKAINSALQRLAVRQQQRHYAATQGTNVLTHCLKARRADEGGVDPAAHQGVLGGAQMAAGDVATDRATGPTAMTAVTASADETFNSFVAESIVRYTEDPVVTAYSQVTCHSLSVCDRCQL